METKTAMIWYGIITIATIAGALSRPILIANFVIIGLIAIFGTIFSHDSVA